MASNAKPEVNFYFVEQPGPAGIRMTVGVECSHCEEQFFDTRAGDRVLMSCVEKAIQHGRSSHRSTGGKFRPRPSRKAKGKFL
jgi:hypothetical protein